MSEIEVFNLAEEKYIKPQTAKIADLSRVKKNETDYRIRKAIQDFLKSGYQISVNAISQATGITRQAIYSRPELKKLIEWYGKYVQGSMPPDSYEEAWMVSRISDIQALENEIEHLYNENKELHCRYLQLQNEIFSLENGIYL